MLDLILAVVQLVLIFGIGVSLFVAGRSYERQRARRYWYAQGVREGVRSEQRRAAQQDQGALLRVVRGPPPTTCFPVYDVEERGL